MMRYAISDGRFAGDFQRFADWISALDDAGVDMVQIREKHLSTRDLYGLVEASLARCLRMRILINTRVDVALARGAHGVHLPSHSPPPAVWRRIVPPGFLFGVSCHSLEEVLAAQSGGASFVVAGPVFDPLSKDPDRPAIGWDGLRRICAASSIPVYALGGITIANAPECIAAGAAGVAGISLFRSGTSVFAGP
jgi:thiamine-phosphate pyrophosphorylase